MMKPINDKRNVLFFFRQQLRLDSFVPYEEAEIIGGMFTDAWLIESFRNVHSWVHMRALICVRVYVFGKCVCFVCSLAMGAIHKMAATLGDSPTARVLRGNFSSQRSLPHLAKHFFLSFLFLLRAKKPHTNENLSGSTPPSRHNADFASTGLRYQIKV